MKILIQVIMWFCAFSFVMAQDISIVPEVEDPNTVTTAVQAVGQNGGGVWDAYNTQAKRLDGKLSEQLASGIFTWDTLLDYLVYLIKFLSQAGLFVGAAMIIYAGYLYATEIFGDKSSSKGKSAIKNAILWVLVITFSYAIIKAINAAFLS